MKNLLDMIKASMLFSTRDPGFLFWCVAYPILLMSIFFSVFGGINIQEKVKKIDIGYAAGSPAQYIAENTEFINGKQMDIAQGSKKLTADKIAGYFEENGTLIVSKEGIDQSIIKNTANTYKKIETLASKGADLTKLDFKTEYVKKVDQKTRPFDTIYFALLAMASLYAYFGAASLVDSILAKNSMTGQRISVSPIKKSKILIGGLVSVMITNAVANILLILYMKFILNMGLVNNIPATLLLILVGNIIGAALGVLIATISSAKTGVKTGLGVALTLTMGFLGGMMSPDIKNVIDENFPILNHLNPVAIIDNNLYRVNMLENYNSYILDSLGIIAVSAAILVIASIWLRRQQYDNI